jgi:hypothetical protein
MIEDFFNKHKSRIILNFAKETNESVYRNEPTYTIVAHTHIDALVNDLNATQIQWKMQGINSSKAKQIIFHKRHLESFKSAYSLRIDSEDYEGWKANGQLQYRAYGDYIQAYVYIKRN